jgi:hypothetical protein
VPEEVLRSYAGHYSSEDTFHPVVIILTFRNGRLYIQNADGSTVALNAESATRFYLTSQEAELVFDPEAAGSFELLNYAPIGGTVFKRVAELKTNDPVAK